MNTNLKAIALMGLLGVTQQAASPLPNASGDTGKFPLYPSPETTSGLKTTDYTLAALGGYRCVRNNLIFGVPQAVASTQVTSSSTIRSFYGTSTSNNGAEGVDTDCCSVITAKADCPSVLKTSNNLMVDGRIPIQYPGRTLTEITVIQATVPAGWNRIYTNQDFILQAMFQNSYSGVGTRNVESCD